MSVPPGSVRIDVLQRIGLGNWNIARSPGRTTTVTCTPVAAITCYNNIFSDISNTDIQYFIGFDNTVNLSIFLLFFFFNSVLRPFQDYFSSYETG